MEEGEGIKQTYLILILNKGQGHPSMRVKGPMHT